MTAKILMLTIKIRMKVWKPWLLKEDNLRVPFTLVLATIFKGSELTLNIKKDL